MTPARILRSLRVGMVVTLMLIGCVSCSSTSALTAPFVRHDAPARVAIRLLIPFQSCVLGIADENRGAVSNWVGEPDCTRLIPSPGDAVSVTDAVPMDDGSIIGVGESLVRRDPDGSVHQLATLPPQFRNSDNTPTPFGLARSGQRLIVAGRKLVYDDQGNGTSWKYVPTVWESTDAGATVREVPLPVSQPRDPLSPPKTSG